VRERKKHLYAPKRFHAHSRRPLDNWCAVPYNFWLLLGEGKLSGGAQMAVLGYLEARQWGTKREGEDNPEWVQVTGSDLARELKLNQGGCEEGLRDAVARGLVEAKDKLGNVSPAALKGQERWYRLCPANWTRAPKYVAPLPRVKPDEPEAAKAEAPAEQPPSTDRVTPESLAATAVVQPGARQAVQMNFIFRALEAPVPIRVRYHNECSDLPLEFSSWPGAVEGEVNVTVRRAGHAHHGEEKAKHRPTAVGRFVPAETPRSEYHKYLSELMLRVWSKPLDEPFLRQIAANAKNAPISTFSTLVEDRLKRERKGFASGLLLDLARDAGKVHNALEQQILAAQARDQSGHDARLESWRETVRTAYAAGGEAWEELLRVAGDDPEVMALQRKTAGGGAV
jgi:hypothetical protein